MSNFTPVTVEYAQPFRWEGRAPACLLIHGLSSTPWEVRTVGEALRDAGYHAEGFWLPGHGSTPEALAAVTWHDWVAECEARFDALHAEQGEVAVLGSSLGGSLALWLAATRPVAAVVTMGGAVWLRGAARFARLMSYVRPYQKKSEKGSSIYDDEARARHPSYPKMPLRAIAEMRDLTEALRPKVPEIRAPLLVMHARQDPVIAPENAPWIIEHAGSARKELIWFERSNHIITEDYEHEAVSAAAVRWIDSVATAHDST